MIWLYSGIAAVGAYAMKKWNDWTNPAPVQSVLPSGWQLFGVAAVLVTAVYAWRKFKK